MNNYKENQVDEVKSTSKHFHQAEFARIVQKYGIVTSKLARDLGFYEAQMSKFRNQKQDYTAERFIQIVNAMPPEAKEEYLTSLFGGTLPKLDNFLHHCKQLVEMASTEEMEEIMLMIADKWRREKARRQFLSRNTQDNTTDLVVRN